MPGTRNPNATLCHSERSEESREERKEILRFALNDKLIVNCQWLIVMYQQFVDILIRELYQQFVDNPMGLAAH